MTGILDIIFNSWRSPGPRYQDYGLLLSPTLEIRFHETLTVSFFSIAICSVGVVTDPDEPVSSISGIHQPIWTGPEDGVFGVGLRPTITPCQLVVHVTVFIMG